MHELNEKAIYNNGILMRINDYYETNLRAISVRSLQDHLKETDRIVETKASALDVKKLVG